MHRVKKRRAYREDTSGLRIAKAVATQLDQSDINTLRSFPSMPCSGSSPGIPLHPEYGNEQTRPTGAGMLVYMHTAKDVLVHVCYASNIRAIN